MSTAWLFAFLAKSRQRLAFFAVIEPGSAAPAQEARRAFTRFFEDNATCLSGIVIVTHRAVYFRPPMIPPFTSRVLHLTTSCRPSFPRSAAGSAEAVAP